MTLVQKIWFGAFAAAALGVIALLIIGFERDFIFDLVIEGIEEKRKATLLVNDVEVAGFAATGGKATPVTGGRARSLSAKVLPRIKLSYWYPCGSQDIPLEVEMPESTAVTKARNLDENIPLKARLQYDKLPDDTHVTLYIDNRKQPARTVRVAGMEIEVKADSFIRDQAVRVDPRCKEGLEISIDGKLAATLPADVPSSRARTKSANETGNSSTLSQFLFDPTGTRCYHLATRHYADKQTVQIWAMMGTGPRDSSQEFKPGHLHRIPYVSFFFEDAPSEVRDHGLATSRTILGDC